MICVIFLNKLFSFNDKCIFNNMSLQDMEMCLTRCELWKRYTTVYILLSFECQVGTRFDFFKSMVYENLCTIL